MADKEKDVPIKEQLDGSVLAKVEVPEGFDDEEEGVEVELKEGGKVEASDDSEEEQAGDDEAADDGETDDEREKIREARREERKLKKELQKLAEIERRTLSDYLRLQIEKIALTAKTQ